MKQVEARGSYSSSSKLIYWAWATGPFEVGRRCISDALPYINVMGPGLALCGLDPTFIQMIQLF